MESNNSAEVHASALVVDLHADTPQRLLDEGYDLTEPLNGGNFNLETARQGNLGAEFFSIWAEPTLYSGRYAHRTLELIDAVKQQVAQHRDRLMLASSPDEIEQAQRERRLAILMGIEGGHSIENSLGLLRQYYELGARYLTLTWNNSNGWAESSGDCDDPNVPHTQDGLSAFGEEVIRAMNRLGMMVDISHVSDRTFWRTLQTSRAPVIASHSSARALCDSPRNLSDEMIRAVANSGGSDSQGGVVMVNFYSGFLSQHYRDAFLELQPDIEKQIQACKNEVQAQGGEVRYEQISRLQKAAADRIPRPPLSLLIDHISHMVKVGGVDHVGLGSDFDGISGQLPEGMDSPADFPKITKALMARGASAEDCRKILGGNLMRVFREVEAASSQLHGIERPQKA
jgi:membrane dipeptidase